MKRVLLISSHTDDLELAAGGTVKRLIEEGDQILHIVFSNCNNVEIVPEFERSMRVLGVTDYHIYNIPFRLFSEHRQNILQILINRKKDFNPQFVITHGSADTNQDHQVVFQESFRAFKTCNLIGYNHPWNTRQGKADYFVKLEQSHLDAKKEALKQYVSQKERRYFNPQYTEAQAISYGTMLQCGYAEAFETLNLVL
jgi:LmbE family N-acetylglucosaminyl deacetylase